MKNRFYSIYLFLFGLMLMWSSPSFAQDFNILCDENKIVFGIPNTGQYVVIGSDGFYTIYPDQINASLPEDLNISDNILRYRNIVSNGQNVYLIHDGGGEIIEYSKDGFKRIDRSFLHHNQYRSTPFSYEGAIYLFAGTGLFQAKNFIIKYNFEAKEWFKVAVSGELPPPGHHYSGLVLNDHFYIFLGASHLDNDIETPDNNVYQLNLKTWVWKNIGTLYDSEYHQYISSTDNSSFTSFTTDGKYYFIGQKKLVEVDLLNNQISFIEANDGWQISGNNYINFLRSDENYLYFQSCDAMRNFEVFQISKSELTKARQSKAIFYESYSERFYKSYGIVLVGILILIVSVTFMDELSIENKVSIKTKSAIFTYRIKVIKIFSRAEKLILLTMALEQNISYSKIEDLCSEETDSQDVRVKKREKTMRMLHAKLDGIFNSSEPLNYFITSSSQEDKRIKFLKLNTLYFRVK